jgi:hypothetical protein
MLQVLDDKKMKPMLRRLSHDPASLAADISLGKASRDPSNRRAQIADIDEGGDSLFPHGDGNMSASSFTSARMCRPMRASDGAIGLPSSLNSSVHNPSLLSRVDSAASSLDAPVTLRNERPPRPPGPPLAGLNQSAALISSSQVNVELQNVEAVLSSSWKSGTMPPGGLIRKSGSVQKGRQPPNLGRQSDYNMILSFERPSVVTDMIKKAIASEFEVAYQMTGETGSCMYMSPEVHDHQPYNQKTDVYSFGVMLYEVFSRVILSTMAEALNPGRYKIIPSYSGAGSGRVIPDG